MWSGSPGKEPRLQAVDLHHKRAGTISALRSGQSQSMPEGADFAGCSVCGNRQAGVNTLSELGVNTERGRSCCPGRCPVAAGPFCSDDRNILNVAFGRVTGVMTDAVRCRRLWDPVSGPRVRQRSAGIAQATISQFASVPEGLSVVRRDRTKKPIEGALWRR